MLRPMRVRGLVVAVLAMAACVGAPMPTMPAVLRDVPQVHVAADRAVAAARLLHERGDAVAAQAALAAVLREQPRHVDGLRLRQDLLRVRGRSGVLRGEIDAMLAADPDDAVALYLRGRQEPDDAAKAVLFRRAADLAPDSLWPWLGLAFALRAEDAAQANDLYARLATAAGNHPVVAVARAASLRQSGDYEGALAAYRELRADPQVPGVGDLGIAQTLLAMDKRRESWPPLLAALRARPFDPGVRALVRDWLVAGLPDEQVEQVLDVLAEEPARWQAFGERDGLPVLAALLQRAQRPHALCELLQRAGLTIATPALRRLQRQVVLATGDVGGFLRILRQDLPPELLADQRNEVRGLWLPLLAQADAAEPVADAAMGLALVTALRDCGLLDEGLELAALVAVRFPAEAAALAPLRDELRQQLAFERALRRLLYQRYLGNETPPLGTVLEEVRQLGRQILGRDVVGRPATFDAPLVGEMLDPFADGLCAHFRRYNKHLVLGRRSGGVVEGMLLTRLSVRELPDDQDLPLPARCREVIGEHRQIRALSGVLGGDLAGVALLNHYTIDFDAVREWADGIRQRRRVAREDELALLRDPLPARVADLEPLDVAWRLAVLSSCEDSGLDLAVLDMIRHHERAHLVDSLHYLPFEQNLFRVSGLLFRFLFSAAAIEAEMERRAEVAAVALSTHPELALAHVADFLQGEPGDSPHARGFRRLADGLRAELIAQGTGAGPAQPHRWHELPLPAVRAAARVLLRGSR